jgi:hypothetical protein
MKTAKVVSSMSKISLDFDENRYVKMMSDLVKSETDSYLNKFLKEKVLPITPVDDENVHSQFKTKKELSTNAKVIVIDADQSGGTPTKYTAYVYFGDDQVSKLYAKKQHERDWYNHTPPARHEFLEFPFMFEIVNQSALENSLSQAINDLF